MRLRAVIILVVLCCVAIIGITRLNSASQVSFAQSFTSASRQTISTAQVESLKDDLNKMRSLVAQMETNLSLVDTTQTPLKHQFQLEIDMWKLEIQRMEKQLQGSR